jgi:chemotaxis methyl-accepting protein methylase
MAGAVRRAFRALGRAGTADSLAALTDIASHRASARGVSDEDYARDLEGDPRERAAVLDVYASVRPLERGFFEGPRVFEELPALVREWSAFADERRLTALALGCGRGWSAVSLAIALSAAGLPERSWTMDVYGLDVSRKALGLAAARRYEESDLAGFPYPRGRWFKNEAGSSRRFKDGGGTFLTYGFGDVYFPEAGGPAVPAGPDIRDASDDPDESRVPDGPGGARVPDGPDCAKVPGGPSDLNGPGGARDPGGPSGLNGQGGTGAAVDQEAEGGAVRILGVAGDRMTDEGAAPVNLLSRFRGKVDVLLARNLSREAPDELVQALPAAVDFLLNEGGLCFTGPGEIWAPTTGVSLEERNGVFFFRKSRSKRKANTFHSPRRGRAAAATAAGPQGAGPDPARYAGAVEDSAASLPDDPERARGKALDAIELASEDMLAWPPAYEALARAEEALGRPGFARQIREAMAIYQGKA